MGKPSIAYWIHTLIFWERVHWMDLKLEADLLIRYNRSSMPQYGLCPLVQYDQVTAI